MFNKIVIVEPVLITEEGVEELKGFCKELIYHTTDTINDEDTISRIGDADCILVSYKTVINSNIINNCKNLKYISMCCSFYGKQYAKVDIDTLIEKGISFSYLKEHGDNGVVEFTLSGVISLLHGFGKKRWKEEQLDLTDIKIGILGLGDIGTKIARTFQLLGSDVYYYSRTRKEHEEENGIKYLELKELLSTVDIISINLNRNVCLIGDDNLNIYGDGKIIVNTSIGYCYEIETLKKWLQNKNNYYICDKPTINDDIKEILNYENVIYTDIITGDTEQCYNRATKQIISNINKYFNEHI